MKRNIKLYEVVGKINKQLAQFAEFNYEGKVYMAPGVKKHIIKRHKNDLNEEVLNNMYSYIKKVIEEPDYVGKHPKKIGNSIELVKKIVDNLLVAIEVDLTEKYIYVASLYPITESKLLNRVNSGRFKKLR